MNTCAECKWSVYEGHGKKEQGFCTKEKLVMDIALDSGVRGPERERALTIGSVPCATARRHGLDFIPLTCREFEPEGSGASYDRLGPILGALFGAMLTFFVLEVVLR